MPTYKLNHHEYTKIIRYCHSIYKEIICESTLSVILELLDVHFDHNNLYFEVPEHLMQRIAILNMCDMTLIQYNDSNGDIDYAMLGEHSKTVINSIINHLI